LYDFGGVISPKGISFLRSGGAKWFVRGAPVLYRFFDKKIPRQRRRIEVLFWVATSEVGEPVSKYSFAFWIAIEARKAAKEEEKGTN
jgi:hypothetical protein